MTEHALYTTMSAESVVARHFEQTTTGKYSADEDFAKQITSMFGGAVKQIEAFTGEDFVTGQKLLTD